MAPKIGWVVTIFDRIDVVRLDANSNDANDTIGANNENGVVDVILLSISVVCGSNCFSDSSDTSLPSGDVENIVDE